MKQTGVLRSVGVLGFLLAVITPGCGRSESDLRVEKQDEFISWTNVSGGPVEITDVSINDGACKLHPYSLVKGPDPFEANLPSSWSPNLENFGGMAKEYKQVESLTYQTGESARAIGFHCRPFVNPINVTITTEKGLLVYSFSK